MTFGAGGFCPGPGRHRKVMGAETKTDEDALIGEGKVESRVIEGAAGGRGGGGAPATVLVDLSVIGDRERGEAEGSEEGVDSGPQLVDRKRVGGEERQVREEGAEHCSKGGDPRGLEVSEISGTKEAGRGHGEDPVVEPDHAEKGAEEEGMALGLEIEGGVRGRGVKGEKTAEPGTVV